MNKKNARDALDLYKKFLIRMDRVADFLKVAEVSLFQMHFVMMHKTKRFYDFYHSQFFILMLSEIRN